MDECLIQQYPELEAKHFWWVSRREFVSGLIGTGGEARGNALDVGCGSGVLAGELAASGATVTGIDVASHPEWSSRGSVVFREGDYLDLASGMGVFDTVLALDVMEHIEDESLFVARLKENVRPDGHVIVTVPAYRWLWSRHDEVNQHFRRYTKSRLRRVLTAGGFNVSRCGYIFFGLVLPKAVSKGLETMRDSDVLDLPSPLLNRMALTYFRYEHRLAGLRRDFLPAGTSVVAVCQRR